MKQRTALNRIHTARHRTVSLCSFYGNERTLCDVSDRSCFVSGRIVCRGRHVLGRLSDAGCARLTCQSTGSVTRSEEGLPIGNGRMGTLLWTEGDTLRMQMNRVDVFGNNSASSSFPQRNSDYCGGCGLVGLKFTRGDAVGGRNAVSVFRRALPAAFVVLRRPRDVNGSQDVKVEAQAWQKDDVIALQITDQRKTEKPGSRSYHRTAHATCAGREAWKSFRYFASGVARQQTHSDAGNCRKGITTVDRPSRLR